MGQTDDFDDTVARDPINHDVPWIADPMLGVNETAGQSEREDTNTSDRFDGARARCVGGCAHCGERGEHQPVVSFGGWNIPLDAASEQDAVDIVLRSPEQSPGQ
jgi:hypothetical protein